MVGSLGEAVSAQTNKAQRTTARAFRALSLAEAKTQCRIAQSSTAHDQELDNLIDVALDAVERDVPWRFASATYTLQLDAWPARDKPIELPVKPVTAVTAIDYYESDVLASLAPTDYRLDTGRVWPVVWRADLNDSWPVLSGRRPQAITVTYSAGFATIAALRDQAAGLRQAALVRLNMLWSDRGLGTIDYERAQRVYRQLILPYLTTCHP